MKANSTSIVAVTLAVAALWFGPLASAADLDAQVKESEAKTDDAESRNKDLEARLEEARARLEQAAHDVAELSGEMGRPLMNK